MVDAVWQIDAKWSGHGLSLAPSPGHVEIHVSRPLSPALPEPFSTPSQLSCTRLRLTV